MQKALLIILALCLAEVTWASHVPSPVRSDQTSKPLSQESADEIENAVSEFKDNPDNLEKIEQLQGLIAQLSDSQVEELIKNNPDLPKNMMAAIDGLRKQMASEWKTFLRDEGKFRDEFEKQIKASRETLERLNIKNPAVESYLNELKAIPPLMKEFREAYKKRSEASDPSSRAYWDKKIDEAINNINKADVRKEMLDVYNQRFKEIKQDLKEADRIKDEIAAIKKHERPATQDVVNNLEKTYQRIERNLTQDDRDKLLSEIERLKSGGSTYSNIAQENPPSNPGGQNNPPSVSSIGKGGSSSGGVSGGSSSAGTGSGSDGLCLACQNKNKKTETTPHESPPPSRGVSNSSGPSPITPTPGFSSNSSASSLGRGNGSFQPVMKTPSGSSVSSPVYSDSRNTNSQAQALANNDKSTTINNYFPSGNGIQQSLPTPSSGTNTTLPGLSQGGSPSEPIAKTTGRPSVSAGSSGGTTGSIESNSNPINGNNSTDNSTWASAGPPPPEDKNTKSKATKLPYGWGESTATTTTDALANSGTNAATEKPKVDPVATNNDEAFRMVLGKALPKPQLSNTPSSGKQSDLMNLNYEAATGTLTANPNRSPASFGLMKNGKAKANLAKAKPIEASGSAPDSNTSRGFMSTVKSIGKSIYNKIASFFGLK